MNFATWLAILICGPGALFVFGWFLRDLLSLRRRHRDQRSPPQD